MAGTGDGREEDREKGEEDVGATAHGRCLECSRIGGFRSDGFWDLRVWGVKRQWWL